MNDTSIKSKAFNSFFWKFSERIGAQSVSLIVSIILARLLVPDDYSVVGIVGIFFAFCNVFISAGLNTSLIQKKDADIIDYSTILFTTLFTSTVLYAVMFFTAPIIADLYDKEILIPVIRVMSLTFFINSFKSVLSAYVSRHLQFKKFFFSTLGGTIASAGIGIAMAYCGFGPWALVAQQMSNSVIDTIILVFTTRVKFKLTFSFQRLKALFGYSWKIFVAGIISIIYDEVNPLVIGLKFSTSDLAYYTKGRSFPNLLNATLSQTLSSVLFPVMSKFQDDKEKILHLTRRYIKTCSYVIFPVMLGFWAVSESFVKILLTDKWLSIVPYIQIFCISYMFNLIQTGNLEAIKAIGRTDISLILEIIKKSLYFVVILLFIFFTDSPVLLAWSAVVCTLLASLINTFPNRKLIGYRYRYQLMDIIPNLVISGIMGVIVILMNKLSISIYLLMPLQIVVGAIIYVTLSIVTKNESFIYLLNTIKQRLGERNAKHTKDR